MWLRYIYIYIYSQLLTKFVIPSLVIQICYSLTGIQICYSLTGYTNLLFPQVIAKNLLVPHWLYKLNKNTLGVKKCEANQKQHCKQVRPKTLISVEAKKLLIKIFFTT